MSIQTFGPRFGKVYTYTQAQRDEQEQTKQRLANENTPYLVHDNNRDDATIITDEETPDLTTFINRPDVEILHDRYNDQVRTPNGQYYYLFPINARIE